MSGTRTSVTRNRCRNEKLRVIRIALPHTPLRTRREGKIGISFRYYPCYLELMYATGRNLQFAYYMEYYVTAATFQGAASARVLAIIEIICGSTIS